MTSKKPLKDVLRLWAPSLKVEYSYLLFDALGSAEDANPDNDEIICVRLKDVLPPNPDYLNGFKNFDLEKNVKVDQYELSRLLEYRTGLLTIEKLISDSRYEKVKVVVDKDMVPKVKSLKEAVQDNIPSKTIFELVGLIDRMSMDTTVFDNPDKLKTHPWQFRSDTYLIKIGFGKIVSELGLEDKIRDGVAVTVDPPHGIFFSGPGLDKMKTEEKQVISSYLSAIIQNLPEFLDLRKSYHSYAALGHFGIGITLGVLGFWGAGSVFEATPYSLIPEAWMAMELTQRVGPSATGIGVAYRNSVSSKERRNLKWAAAIGLPVGPIIGTALHYSGVSVDSPAYAPTQIFSQYTDDTAFGSLEVAGSDRSRMPSRWEKFKSIVKNPWCWLYGGSMALASVCNVVARYLGVFPSSLTRGVGPEMLITSLVGSLPPTIVSWLQVYRKYKDLSFLNSDESIESYISNPVEYNKLQLGRYYIRIPKPAEEHTHLDMRNNLH